MRVRISTAKRGNTTTIRIEGHLGAPESILLLEECRSVDQPLRLGLAGLVSADDAGIRALRSFQAEGAELIGASPYVQQLLNAKTVAAQETADE